MHLLEKNSKFKPEPIWVAGNVGGRFTHYDTMLGPKVITSEENSKGCGPGGQKRPGGVWLSVEGLGLFLVLHA